MEFLSVEPTLKRYRLQKESAQKGKCNVEEYADIDHLQPTSTTVEMGWAVGVVWLEIVMLYINQSEIWHKQNRGEM